MKRSDRIRLNFIRNWPFPGKERLSHFFHPSKKLKNAVTDGIVWLKDEDIAIYTTADNYIEWTILSTGTYEDEISKIIRMSVRTGDNCLDIGGNIGLQSIRMAQCAGASGRIFAFEPLYYLKEKFERNVALNRITNVTVFPFALSDAEAEIEASIDPGAWNQGSFSLNHDFGPEKQQVLVKVADKMTEIDELSAISLVKIDVEGFEFHVLRGMRRTLEKHKPRIIFEYDENYWRVTGQKITGCFDYLVSLGYRLYQVTSVGCELITDAKHILGGNLLCIPV